MPVILDWNVRELTTAKLKTPFRWFTRSRRHYELLNHTTAPSHPSDRSEGL